MLRRLCLRPATRGLWPESTMSLASLHDPGLHLGDMAEVYIYNFILYLALSLSLPFSFPLAVPFLPLACPPYCLPVVASFPLTFHPSLLPLLTTTCIPTNHLYQLVRQALFTSTAAISWFVCYCVCQEPVKFHLFSKPAWNAQRHNVVSAAPAHVCYCVR